MAKKKYSLEFHWSVFIIILSCLAGIFLLLYQSMYFEKTIPQGGLAAFSSIASLLIGYSAGKGENQ